MDGLPTRDGLIYLNGITKSCRVSYAANGMSSHILYLFPLPVNELCLFIWLTHK